MGLTNLTKSITDKIESWRCPLCFEFSSNLEEKLKELSLQPKMAKTPDTDDTEAVECNEGSTTPSDTTKRMHKDIREIKDILLKNVIPRTVETTTKVEEVLDANWRRQSQSWASVVENQKSIERKISNQHSIGSVVNEAVDTSRKKMERDNAERKLRECNCDTEHS